MYPHNSWKTTYFATGLDLIPGSSIERHAHVVLVWQPSQYINLQVIQQILIIMTVAQVIEILLRVFARAVQRTVSRVASLREHDALHC